MSVNDSLPAAPRSALTYVLDEPARILVVDDDPIFREFAGVYLASPVVPITVAADGVEALDLIAREAFDLVLCDLEMPGLDGFGVIERLRGQARTRHLPVVLVTGREDIVSIDRAYALGATSFVTKPVNWRQLAFELRYVMRNSRAEAAARADRDRAEQAGALREHMLAVIRHEFRTPLNAMTGFAGLIEGLDPQAPGALGACVLHARQIRAAADRLGRVLGEVLSFAELAGQGCVLREDEYPLARLIREAGRRAADEARAAGVALVLEEGPAGMTVQCDLRRAATMIGAVVDNAVRFSPRGATVRVEVRPAAAGGLTVSVSDDGPGIAADRLAACLAPFGQSDMTRARTAEGLGLGLPVAARIAELHGVRFEVETAPGAGTVVHFTWPAARIGQVAGQVAAQVGGQAAA